MTPEEKAKQIVNKIYQPMGYLHITESSNTMWKYATERAIEFVEMLIFEADEKVFVFGRGNRDNKTYWQEVLTILKMN